MKSGQPRWKSSPDEHCALVRMLIVMIPATSWRVETDPIKSLRCGKGI